MVSITIHDGILRINTLRRLYDELKNIFIEKGITETHYIRTYSAFMENLNITEENYERLIYSNMFSNTYYDNLGQICTNPNILYKVERDDYMIRIFSDPFGRGILLQFGHNEKDSLNQHIDIDSSKQESHSFMHFRDLPYQIKCHIREYLPEHRRYIGEENYLEFHDGERWLFELIDNLHDDTDLYTILKEFGDTLFAPFSELVSRTGLSLKEISNSTLIPYRTMQDWYSGISECKPYMRLFIAEHFNLI